MLEKICFNHSDVLQMTQTYFGYEIDSAPWWPKKNCDQWVSWPKPFMISYLLSEWPITVPVLGVTVPIFFFFCFIV